MGTMTSKQRGVSLEGFLVVVVVLIFVAVAALKVAPAYLQDRTIKSKFEEVAHDPDLKNAQAHEIQAAFRKRAAVSDITNIKAEDIEVSRDNGEIILSVSYAVKVPLIANASLLLEFNTSNAK